MYRQVVLAHDSDHGLVTTTGWMDDPRVMVGVRLTLKHDRETIRTVVAIWKTQHEAPPNNGWKVGGLM